MLLPPLAVAVMMLRYPLDFPMLDQWELVPLLQKWQAGRFRLGDLLAQHNEHRPVLFRAIVLPLAILTRWEVRIEPWLAFACALGTFVLLHGRLSSMRPSHGLSSIVLAVLLFSAAQWQNFLLGWQFQLMLGACLCLSCLHCLTRNSITPKQVTVAAALALAATFTFGNGALLWPVGALILWARLDCILRERFAFTAGWLALGALAIAGYLWNFERVVSQGSTFLPGPLVAYALAYLGAPLFPYHPLGAALLGGLGIVAATWLALRMRSASESDAGPRFFFVGLLLLAVGSALITAHARGSQGMEQALSSRYATFALWFWIALLFGALESLPRAVCLRASMAILALAAAASMHGAYRWSEHANAYATARPALLNLQFAPELRWLYPDEQRLLERAAWLKEGGWSLYRHP